MKPVVYIDVLLTVNLLVDYLLLSVAGRFVPGKLSRGRLLLGAVAGAAASCVILLPRLPFPLGALVNLSTCAAMTLIAYGFGSAGRFLRGLAAMLACTVAYGGFMFALWMFLSPRGLEVRNGVVYINISPGLLISATVICYAAMTVFARVAAKRNIVRSSCALSVQTDLGTARMRGVIDTGNLLTEPFSEYPVILAERAAVAAVLDDDFLAAVDSGCINYNDPDKTALGGGRIIPFSSVGGDGLLLAFKPRLVTIEHNDKKTETDRVYVGVLARGRVSGDGQAIINPDALD